MALLDFFRGIFGGTESANWGWTVRVEGKTNQQGEEEGTATFSWSDPDAPEAVFTMVRSGVFTPEVLTKEIALVCLERDRWLKAQLRKAEVANTIQEAVNQADPGPGASL